MPATIGELRTSVAIENKDPGPHPHSSFDLKQYERRRKKVAELAKRLAEIAEQLGAPESAGSLRQSVSSMYEDVFKIVVVGEFSRGKSTVINALLGAQVLPKSPSETTAVLSQVDYSDVEAYSIHFRDGRPAAEVSAEYFASLVAPPEPLFGDDPSTRAYEDCLAFLHTIEYVRIGYPCELCRDGVRIIDTPGTNGLNPAREEITFNVIPSADAVIFVLSAQNPATASELAFLRDQVMAADLGKIFLVMNFADSIGTPTDRERVVSHAKREIGSIIPSPEIYLVSAREALYHRLGKKTKLSLSDSGYPLLESDLALFLSSERGWARLAKPLDRGSRVSAELGRNLTLQRRTLELPIAELKKKVEQIQPRLKAVAGERDAALKSLTLQLSNKGVDLANEWRQGLEEIASLADKALASYQGAIDCGELTRWVESAVARPQTDLNEKMQVAQRLAVGNAMTATQNRLKATWDDFYVHFDRVFSFESESRPAEGPLPHSAPEPLVLVSQSLGLGALLRTAASFLGWFLSSLFTSERAEFDAKMQAAIKERYSKSIPDRIDKWSVGWLEHISSVEKALRDECNRKLSDIQNQLNISVVAYKSAEGSAQQKLDLLNDLEAEIHSIQTGFNGIKNERKFSK